MSEKSKSTKSGRHHWAFLRLNKEEKQRLIAAAQQQNFIHVSTWVRKVIFDKVDEVLQDRTAQSAA